MTGKIVNNKRIDLTKKDIEAMVDYINAGKTLKFIASLYGISTMAVQRATKDIIGTRVYNRVSKEAILSELKKGKNTQQVALELGTDYQRVELLLVQNPHLISKKCVKLIERQEEIKKLNLEIERQKKIKEKELQKQLKIEKQDLARRFKGIVK